MSSTYSPSLRIELITTGDQAGTWGNTTNTNLGTLVESAIAGYTSVSVTSANQALTALNGVADQSRNMTIALTTTTSAVFNVYAPPAEKTYVIYNASAYAATLYNSTVLGNTTAAGTGVVIPAGKTMTVWSDGTNFAAQNTHTSSLTLTTPLAVTSGGTGASTASGARTSLGLGTIATQDANNVNITGGSITGVTDSGGTANGVVYLNGSKAFTSGSALTFDGNNLGATFLGAKAAGSVLIANLYYDPADLDYRYVANGPATLFYTGGTGLADYTWTAYPTGTAGDLVSSSTELMRLTSSGRLGLGTNTPNVKLDISSATDDGTAAVAINWGGGPASLNISNSGGIATFTQSVGAGAPIFNWKTDDGVTVTTPLALSATNLSVNANLTFSGIAYATGSSTTVLSMGGSIARSISMERHGTANTAGNSLTVRAGGATSGATDKSGGTLALSSGTSTGTGTSSITFATSTAGGAGTADNTPLTRMILDGSGNLLLRGTDLTALSPSYVLSFGGNSARTIGMERHTTANTAGNSLTLLAGGATSGATDKSGGTLALSSGTATGSGSSVITFSTAVAGTAGTADRAPSERARIDASGNLLITSSGGLGYGTGSGGAVTQATSRTTGVTLDKTNGAITLVSAAGTTTWQTFTVTNNKVAATDTIIVNQKSGTDLNQIFVTNVAAGSFKISFATTGGTTTEQPVFNFAVIKAVTS